MRQVSRDPFARTTLMRQHVRVEDLPSRYTVVGVVGLPPGCDECGNFNANGGLFRYGTERDDRAGPNWHKGLFCSKSCHDAYHG